MSQIEGAYLEDGKTLTNWDVFNHREVKYWITINEPNLVAEMGYMRGKYPPAHCSDPFGNCPAGNSDVEPLVVMHNMLLAHAKAVKIYRELFQAKQGGVIGIVASASMYEPLTENEVDQEAANRALAFKVAWVFDPLVFGDYPPEMFHYHGNDLPRFSAEEKNLVKGSIDFIGINHYSTLYAKDCIYSSCTYGGDRPIQGFANTTGERNGIPIGERVRNFVMSFVENITGGERFFVVPRGMEGIVNYVKERYHNKPMYILENGYSPPRQQDVQVQELLNDAKRVEYHKAYLASLARAIR
ncbi:beta-glucosidase [Sarracenia purpurea var. burkii]